MDTQAPLVPAIEQFLQEKQFTLQPTLATGRYTILRGRLPSYKTDIVIKFRKEPALFQHNHVLWTKAMQDTVPRQAHFHIAPVLEQGSIGDMWHWFVMPFVEGTPFATMHDQYLSSTSFSNNPELLDRIVALMRHIEKTEARSAIGIDARAGGVARRDKLKILEHAIDWARTETPYVVQLLQIINKNFAYLGTANSHGDFTETNIIVNANNEPVLIDAEISEAYNYKSYDAVEFYNRLFTRLCRPELAKTFLKQYVAALPLQTHRRFFSNFLCLSALRCLGNMTEIAAFTEGTAKQQRLKLEKQYAEAIVSYAIITL